MRFLRRKLGLQDHESVFCYVNSVFAPGLDEGVGNLWRVGLHGKQGKLILILTPWQCFRVGEELVVSYSVTQAFG